MTTPNDTDSGKQRPWPKLLTKPTVPMPRAGVVRRAEPIATGTEWTVGTLERFDRALAAHAARLGLDTYPIQYELITANQMLDLCSTVGMPIHYAHWSLASSCCRRSTATAKA